jgi:hypothetical protein
VKPEWTAYLEAIGASEVVRTRVDQIEDIYRRNGATDFETIFISEYVKEDGTRELESLWFFNATVLGEAKQFLSDVDIDLASYEGRVSYYHVTALSFDFRLAVPESRLKVEMSLMPRLQVILKASGNNCDFLLALVRDRLVPNGLAGPLTDQSSMPLEQDAGV